MNERKRERPTEEHEMPMPYEPPDARRTLLAILNAYALKHQALPSCMPFLPRDAVDWWLSRQEPEASIERPRQLCVSGNQKGQDRLLRWEAPYVLRVSQTLIKFLSMPASQQRIITAGIQDGIPWRGDDYDRYLSIVDEHERMRETGVDEYRRQALRRFRHALEKVA